MAITCQDGPSYNQKSRSVPYPGLRVLAQIYKEVREMPRQLISLIDYVKEAQERGDDLNSLYIDPEEVAELDSDDLPEE